MQPEKLRIGYKIQYNQGVLKLIGSLISIMIKDLQGTSLYNAIDASKSLKVAEEVRGFIVIEH